MKHRFLIFSFFAAVGCLIFQQSLFLSNSFASDSIDYSFDTTALTAKPIDLSASIECYPSLLFYNRNIPFYSLKFKKGKLLFADNYNVKTEAYIQYQRKPLLAFVSGSLNGSYIHQDDSLYGNAKLYETYLKCTPDATFSFLLGKRLLQWGKGYSYNPVSFAGRIKDINNIDAALEGYWNVSFEYVKSFDLPLSSIAVNAVFLPVYHLLNEDYLPDKSAAMLMQLYMLLLNTDFDLYFLVDNKSNIKTGLDFSRNLRSNWEIHGEWAFIKNSNSSVFSDESTLVIQTHPASNLVIGTRYLAPSNTTFILEYLHIGSGYTMDEMEGYWNAFEYASTTADPKYIKAALKANSQFFSSQFVATDYVYFKASHPDPFNFVYFTPSIYAIVNIIDKSTMMGIEMNYSRLAHFLFTGRYIESIGSRNSEYGSKLVHNRFELRVKWSF
jgi:hypothetical protein